MNASATTYRQRRAGRSGPSLWRMLKFGVAIALAAIGMGYVGKEFVGFLQTSDRFHVNSVRIEGLQRLDEDTVLLQSGVVPGANVLFFDRDAVRDNVTSMPYVKRCDVSMMYPNSVVVRIEERVPYLTLMINSRAFEIDEDCVVLREYAMDEMPTAPFVTNVQGLEFVELGARLENSALQAAVDVWRAYSFTRMVGEVEVSELAALSSSDLRMYFDDLSYEVRWSAKGAGNQARRVDILWADRAGRLPCLEYLDLRFGADLACK